MAGKSKTLLRCFKIDKCRGVWQNADHIERRAASFIFGGCCLFVMMPHWNYY